VRHLFLMIECIVWTPGPFCFLFPLGLFGSITFFHVAGPSRPLPDALACRHTFFWCSPCLPSSRGLCFFNHPTSAQPIRPLTAEPFPIVSPIIPSINTSLRRGNISGFPLILRASFQVPGTYVRALAVPKNALLPIWFTNFVSRRKSFLCLWCWLRS